MQNELEANHVVGLFEQHQQAQDAVDLLLSQGFSKDAISVQINRRATNTEVHTRSNRVSVNNNTIGGVAVGGIAGLLLGVVAVVTPSLHGVVGGGPLPLALMGAGVGAIGGGIIGAMNSMGTPACGENLYQEAIKRGATVVTVTASGNDADRCGELLRQSHALCVDVNAGPQRRGGWQEVPTAATPDAPKPMNQPHSTTSSKVSG